MQIKLRKGTKNMKTKSDMKQYIPVDKDFIDKAKGIQYIKYNIPVSAEKLFAYFEIPETWTLWLPFKKVTWLTEIKTNGRRIINTKSGDCFEEFFLRWEPSKRITFRIDKSTIGLLTAFAEDFIIEPDGENKCILHFKFRFKMNRLWKIIAPLMNLIYRFIAISCHKKLIKLVSSASSSTEQS